MIRIFGGSTSKTIAKQIAKHTNIKSGSFISNYFSNKEIYVEICDDVTGDDIFIVQSICDPVNDNLMELLILVDALKRCDVKNISAIIPYLGYARQDRKANGKRVAIAAKLVANMLVASGIDKIITVDLHNEQIQGFFDIPIENIYAGATLVTDLKNNNENMVIVSPDLGGVLRCRNIADLLNTKLQIIDKYSKRNLANDIAGKECIIVDDIIDSATTICNAAEFLHNNGAKSIAAYVTHPVLSANSIVKIQESPVEKLTVTDTIPLKDDAKQCSKIKQISIAKLLCAKLAMHS